MGEAKQEVENKQEEKAEEKKEEKAAGPPPPIVLSLDLHCVGCARKIEKCMLRCRGVESVEVDMMQNTITVKGIVDPQALCSRIQKRTQRQVRVLSPLPPNEGDDPKPEADPPQESGMSTVELLVNMHCEGCAEQLKRKILKMRGVQMAKTDMTAGKVTVTGTVTGEKIVEYIHRRTGKIASIVLPPPKDEEEKKKEEKKPEEKALEDKSEEKKKDSNEKKEEEGKASELQENANAKKEGDAKDEEKKEADIVSVSQDDMMKRMMYWPGNFGEEEMARRMMVHWVPVYMIQQPPPPPPQLFSDENPNASKARAKGGALHVENGCKEQQEQGEWLCLTACAGFMCLNGTQAFQLQHPMIAAHNMLELLTLETGSPLVVPPINSI